MIRETLAKAIKLNNTLKVLNAIENFVSDVNGFMVSTIDQRSVIVDHVSVGTEIKKEIEDAIAEVVYKHQEKIEAELEAL